MDLQLREDLIQKLLQSSSEDSESQHNDKEWENIQDILALFNTLAETTRESFRRLHPPQKIDPAPQATRPSYHSTHLQYRPALEDESLVQALLDFHRRQGGVRGVAKTRP